ncbi:hypothetical protein CISIN_1g034014mg [Citrus sinensis]|uniref:Uncharacterized protein n=1 Tax=Citrus sinensis TaxID=2711 RepID=A0A067EGV9_CITSI|nr:hypothetical protein CISIN_1g034014mg [Citrus sinensis]
MQTKMSLFRIYDWALVFSMQYAEKAKEAMSSLPKVFASKLGIPFSNLAKPSSSRFETLIQFSTSELYSNHHCWFLEASEPDI